MTRGVVFDLDGVLADTERLHWRAYREVLSTFGVDVDLEEYRRRFIARGGGPEYACRAWKLPVTPDELRARKAPGYLALLRAGVAPRPGAVAAVARLATAFRLAVATNAARAEVALILEQLGLRERFTAIVAREDYRAPKPAPDAYRTAAAALALPPADCVVIEDTQRGLEAGLAAGMRVVAAPNDLTHDNDFTGCAARVEHLDELDVALLKSLEA